MAQDAANPQDQQNPAGQAPAGSQAPEGTTGGGQAPQVDVVVTGTTGGTGGQQEPEVFDKAYVQSLRQEAAGYRTQKSQLEQERDALAAKVQEFEDSQKTEEQKRQEEFERVTSERDQFAAAFNDLSLKYDVAIRAPRMGIVDPEAAVALLPRGELQFGDDGNPTNLDNVLNSLLTQRPYLKGQTHVPDSGATTPPGGGSHTTRLTMDQIQRMSPDEINARWDEVQAVMKSQQ